MLVFGMASPSTREMRQDSARRVATKSFARRLRDVHLYLGTFFAPAILFFAFTGTLQTFGLHESHPGDPYQAPVWIQKLARIHKDQTPILPPARKSKPRPPEVKANPAAAPEQEQKGNPTTVLFTKWFVALMSAGLIATTLLGLYMAFKFSPGRGLTWFLLILGAVLPLVLVLAQ